MFNRMKRFNSIEFKKGRQAHVGSMCMTKHAEVVAKEAIVRTESNVVIVNKKRKRKSKKEIEADRIQKENGTYYMTEEKPKKARTKKDKRKTKRKKKKASQLCQGIVASSDDEDLDSDDDSDVDSDDDSEAIEKEKEVKKKKKAEKIAKEKKKAEKIAKEKKKAEKIAKKKKKAEKIAVEEKNTVETESEHSRRNTKSVKYNEEDEDEAVEEAVEEREEGDDEGDEEGDDENGPEVLEDGQVGFVVTGINKHRQISGRTMYFVSWGGRNKRGKPWADSWVSEAQLTGCQDLLEKYMTRAADTQRQPASKPTFETLLRDITTRKQNEYKMQHGKWPANKAKDLIDVESHAEAVQSLQSY